MSWNPNANSWVNAIAISGSTVYVGGASRHNVHELTLSQEGVLAPSRVFEVTPAAQRKATDFLGDVAISPDGRLVYAADLYNNAVKVINPQSGRVIEFQNDQIEELQRMVAEKLGYKLVDHRLELYGIPKGKKPDRPAE